MCLNTSFDSSMIHGGPPGEMTIDGSAYICDLILIWRDLVITSHFWYTSSYKKVNIGDTQRADLRVRTEPQVDASVTAVVAPLIHSRIAVSFPTTMLLTQSFSTFFHSKSSEA